MILRALILCCCILSSSADQLKGQLCLTGYMTYVQSWVDEVGSLISNKVESRNAIDLSANTNPVPALSQQLSLFRYQRNSVKYLSLARCQLTRIPAVFQLQDSRGRYLFATLEYMTFYGNDFSGMSSVGQRYSMSFNATGATEMQLRNGTPAQLANIWSSGLSTVKFQSLKELDLRACSIQVLGENLFQSMPNLNALYIGENQITEIDSTAFLGLNNLIHLDISRNQAQDENGNSVSFSSDCTLGNLEKLVSLDLSYTRMSQRNLALIRSLGKSLKSLSLCETGLNNLRTDIFNTTSLQFLDLSGNNGILTFHNPLRGIEKTLKILSAREVGLPKMEIVQNLTNLEILQLSNNEIQSVRDTHIINMSKLLILDLDKNRLTSWFRPTYSVIRNLKFLSLRDNNINIITEEMIEDLKNINYVALSGNFMVCNCHAKDLYKMAAKNEKLYNNTQIKMPKNQFPHNGYSYYNIIINNRNIVELDCDGNCFSDIEDTGRIRLVDYHASAYMCLNVPESKSVQFSNLTSCSMVSRELNYDRDLIVGKRKLLALLTIPCMLLPVAILFVFRSRIRYFFITMRNSAMLSLINKNEAIHDNTIFNYDVFVSYCNEDRGWVLDHLLPHMEAECSISVCLHERDFQVGLSILENIVSCMDRSKSIMLIISQRFLLSQWCQFEMHLAQHRLLETRREDLTLVLLEDIPRRLRPNTLHYLMLTKTYIVWPKEKSERYIFWRRLKKTLISQKTKHIENVSLA